MCGPAGSGKTTWVKKMVEASEQKCVHISRDVVRVEFLKDEDKNIFMYEDEVFDEFCNRINKALHTPFTDISVFADATHLSENARNKVLDKLDLCGVNIIPVAFNLSLQQTLDQNELRRDIKRAYVPRSVIRRMFYCYEKPTYDEKYLYKNILVVGDFNKEYIKMINEESVKE